MIGSEAKQDLPLDPEQVERAYREQSANNFTLFVAGLVIPSSHGPDLFHSCMAPYQREDFKLLSASLSAIRNGQRPRSRRIWIERTKGAGKDSDLALCLLWLLAFARNPLYLQVGAADKTQAGIIKRRMVDVLHYNQWLNDFVEIQSWKVYNKPGRFVELDILAADIAGSHGDLPDVLVINELSHVTKKEFLENLLDNAEKSAGNLVIIATNAGFKGSFADRLRKNAKENPKRWSVRVLSEPAPWIDKEDLQDAKNRNTTSRFNRRWWGKWSSGKGDALDEEDIDRVLSVHAGPISKPEKGWTYIAGLDQGISHDHSAFVIVGVNQVERRVRLGWMKAWKPEGPGSRPEVDLIDVENTVLAMHGHFKLQYVGYDPTECRVTSQQLRRKGVPMQEVSFASAKNLSLMAQSLVQLVSGHQIGKQGDVNVTASLEAYDDDEGRLRRDFGKLSIVERPGGFGYKLEAVSDEYGHADVGIALAICLPRAIDLLAGRMGLQPDEDLVGDEDDLSEEEYEEMPDELKDLYGNEPVGKSPRPFRDAKPKRKYSDEEPFGDLFRGDGDEDD